MPISKAQRERRRLHIGSSDSPAIVGVDPWRTVSDVYIEKTQDLDDFSNEAIEIGNTFERPLLEWASEQLGVKFDYDVELVKPGTMFAANLDAAAMSKKMGGEAKTTSMPQEYGDEGTDQVPDRVIIQAQHQMYVAGLDVVWIPVLMAKFDRLRRRMYKVTRDERIIKGIETHGSEFWNEHVVPRIPPQGFTPSLDVISRVRRIPEQVANVDPVLVERYELAKESAKKWKEEVSAAKANLLAAGGDSEAFDYGDDEYLYVYPQQTREGIDARKLKLNMPDLWSAYRKESRPFRVLRRVKRESK